MTDEQNELHSNNYITTVDNIFDNGNEVMKINTLKLHLKTTSQPFLQAGKRREEGGCFSVSAVTPTARQTE